MLLFLIVYILLSSNIYWGGLKNFQWHETFLRFGGLWLRKHRSNDKFVSYVFRHGDFGYSWDSYGSCGRDKHGLGRDDRPLCWAFVRQNQKSKIRQTSRVDFVRGGVRRDFEPDPLVDSAIYKRRREILATFDNASYYGDIQYLLLDPLWRVGA